MSQRKTEHSTTLPTTVPNYHECPRLFTEAMAVFRPLILLLSGYKTSNLISREIEHGIWSLEYTGIKGTPTLK